MNNNLPSVDKLYSPLQEMRLLSQGKVHDTFLSYLNGKDVDNQFKLFLAAQARNELQRILRLTEFLDNIEQKFMATVNKKLIEQPDNINLLMSSMDIISQSLKRSQELVYNVLKDDSLQTLVVNTVKHIPGSDNTSIMTRKSRDAIRSVASKLISDLQSEDIIEVEVKNYEATPQEVVENNTTNSDVENTNVFDNKLNELLSDD